MSLTQNEATRFINVIDERIKKLLGRGTVLEITYGEVDSISGRKCAVLIGGDTNPSGGFRIPAGLRVQVGDRVRVVIDPRGDRWVAEVFQTTTYPKLLVDPLRGTIYSGDGVTDPTVMLYTDGLWTVQTDGGIYAGDASMVDADLDVSGNLAVGGDITATSSVTAPQITSSSNTSVGGVLTVGSGTSAMGLVLSGERAWQFEQRSGTSGASSILQLRDLSGSKVFAIVDLDDTPLFAVDNNTDEVRVGTIAIGPTTTGNTGVALRKTGSAEIISASGGTAYIDFKEDANVDFSARIGWTASSGLTVSGSSLNISSGLVIKNAGTQVLGPRRTGWSPGSGTSTRTTFATSTVTTAQLAERVKALIDDLISHGIIGA